MTNLKRFEQYGLEDIKEDITGIPAGVMSDTIDDLEHNDESVVIEKDINTMVETADGLQIINQGIEAAIIQGGLESDAAAFALLSIDQSLNRIGVNSIIPSNESINYDPANKLTFSLEAKKTLGERIKAVWKAIVNAVKSFFIAVRNFFIRALDFSSWYVKDAKKLKEKLSQIKNFDVNESEVDITSLKGGMSIKDTIAEPLDIQNVINLFNSHYNEEMMKSVKSITGEVKKYKTSTDIPMVIEAIKKINGDNLDINFDGYTKDADSFKSKLLPGNYMVVMQSKLNSDGIVVNDKSQLVKQEHGIGPTKDHSRTVAELNEYLDKVIELGDLVKKARTNTPAIDRAFFDLSNALEKITHSELNENDQTIVSYMHSLGLLYKSAAVGVYTHNKQCVMVGVRTMGSTNAFVKKHYKNFKNETSES